MAPKKRVRFERADGTVVSFTKKKSKGRGAKRRKYGRSTKASTSSSASYYDPAERVIPGSRYVIDLQREEVEFVGRSSKGRRAAAKGVPVFVVDGAQELQIMRRRGFLIVTDKMLSDATYK